MSSAKLNHRLASLDFFRGFVMFLLIAEFSHLFEVLMDSRNEQFTAVMDFLFHHAKWEGLHFWDLVQPFFMFIVLLNLHFEKPKKTFSSNKKGENMQDFEPASPRYSSRS